MEKPVLFTLPFCPYCFKAKQFLKEHNIPFREKKILNPAAFWEMRKVTDSLRVPIIKVKDRVLTGFSLEEYKEVFTPENDSEKS